MPDTYVCPTSKMDVIEVRYDATQIGCIWANSTVMIIDGENKGNLGRKPMRYRGADYGKDAFRPCILGLKICRNVVRSAPFPQNHSFVKLHSSAMGIRKCPDWQLDFLSREWCKFSHDHGWGGWNTKETLSAFGQFLKARKLYLNKQKNV